MDFCLIVDLEILFSYRTAKIYNRLKHKSYESFAGLLSISKKNPGIIITIID